jgi:hypothetical protein
MVDLWLRVVLLTNSEATFIEFVPVAASCGELVVKLGDKPPFWIARPTCDGTGEILVL